MIFAGAALLAREAFARESDLKSETSWLSRVLILTIPA
jgi:hypothetical protein